MSNKLFCHFLHGCHLICLVWAAAAQMQGRLSHLAARQPAAMASSSEQK